MRTSRGDRHLPWESFIVVIGPHAEGQTNLFKVADAINALSLGLGFSQRWKQQSGENGNNGDDDQQLNKRKCL